MKWVVIVKCEHDYNVITDKHHLNLLEMVCAYQIWITPTVPEDVRKLCLFRVAPRGGSVTIMDHNADFAGPRKEVRREGLL